MEPFHCLGCVWSQRDKKENRNLAPTVRATISQFNAVTNRVITSLLCTSPHLPSTSSPGLSPSLSSNFLYPSSAPSSPCILRTSPCHRARVIERWIAVAQVCITKYFEINKKFPSKNKMRTQERPNLIVSVQECRELKNFSSLRAILSALQSNAVYRLKKTWAAVSRSANISFILQGGFTQKKNILLQEKEIFM